MDWEKADGTMEKWGIGRVMEELFRQACFRFFEPWGTLFPLFIWATVTPSDRRF